MGILTLRYHSSTSVSGMPWQASLHPTVLASSVDYATDVQCRHDSLARSWSRQSQHSFAGSLTGAACNSKLQHRLDRLVVTNTSG